MHIIKKSQIKTITSYFITYVHYNKDVSYSFNCNKDGSINTKLNNIIELNMYNQVKHNDDYYMIGPEGFNHSYPEPGEFVCDCGRINITYLTAHVICPHCGNVYDENGNFVKQMDMTIKNK